MRGGARQQQSQACESGTRAGNRRQVAGPTKGEGVPSGFSESASVDDTSVSIQLLTLRRRPHDHQPLRINPGEYHPGTHPLVLVPDAFALRRIENEQVAALRRMATRLESELPLFGQTGRPG